MHIASIGIDLGKTTFHPVALGERNKVLVRKKCSRSQLLAYTANLPSSLNRPRGMCGCALPVRGPARAGAPGATHPNLVCLSRGVHPSKVCRRMCHTLRADVRQCGLFRYFDKVLPLTQFCSRIS
jgi:hypothetical protein